MTICGNIKGKIESSGSNRRNHEAVAETAEDVVRTIPSGLQNFCMHGIALLAGGIPTADADECSS